MKHTYIYPIGDEELCLWRTSRMGAEDLFGYPDVDKSPDTEWVLQSRISDALGAARDELHKRLETRDRICIGRHYMIPGSLSEVARSHEWDADRTVREITQKLWDAPHFYGHTFVDVRSRLIKTAGQDGRDDRDVIDAFCKEHRVTKDNGKRIRVVPVWM